MNRRKTLKELTLKDNFLFCAVMAEEENCRGLLEMLLDFPIEHIEVSREKSIVYQPEYRGVRLDLYARDAANTRYNIEMQVAPIPALSRRSRYYHSQIDMELLLAGQSYPELPDVYVIFICDFDPFGLGRYMYTFENVCLEDHTLKLREGCKTLFLSTQGKNPSEVPEKLVRFLHFVKADLRESQCPSGDPYVARLQSTIARMKSSREWEERFMTLEELIRDERAEAWQEGKNEERAESILMLLESIGTVPEELAERIREEKSPELLKEWLLAAARAGPVGEFSEQMHVRAEEVQA